MGKKHRILKIYSVVIVLREALIQTDMIQAAIRPIPLLVEATTQQWYQVPEDTF